MQMRYGCCIIGFDVLLFARKIIAHMTVLQDFDLRHLVEADKQCILMHFLNVHLINIVGLMYLLVVNSLKLPLATRSSLFRISYSTVNT
jgi:hypothetical protein